MSAEVLREAAALMRSRAEAATPGPWTWGKLGIFGGPQGFDDVLTTGAVECMSYCYGGSSTLDGDRLDGDCEHIAAWHPAVALAVADLLDNARCRLHCGDNGMRSPYCSRCADSGDDHECPAAEPCDHSADYRRALAVARAYLDGAA